MNKKTIYVVISLLIIVIAGAFWYKSSQDKVAELDTSPNPGVPRCLAQFGKVDKQNLYDKYTLKMLFNGDKVNGELKFLPAEKDSKLGKFEGTVIEVDEAGAPKVVSAIWEVFVEGTSNKEELRIMLGEGKASIGFGEMVVRDDGVYGYKDPSKIAYSLDLVTIPCSDIDEREVVDNNLRLDIATLSPVKAQLGGTWYVVGVFVDMAKNSGTVVYEDGHVQEKREFVYTTGENNALTSMMIK